MKAMIPMTAAVLLATSACGQGLTNAEVFDYDLGDVVQSKYYYYGPNAGAWPHRYIRDSIIGVAFNVGGLEVEYTSAQHRFCLPGGPFPAEDTVMIVQFGYVDGTAYPEHADLGVNCPYYVPLTDTVAPWDLFCERTTWLQTDHVPCDTCECWEAGPPWFSRFVAGVGGPYHWAQPWPTGIVVQHELVYYHKGTDVCGTEFVMGTDGSPARATFAVMPNPAEDEVRWTGNHPNGSALLMDMAGRILLRATDSGHMDIAGLPPGSYQLLLQHDRGTRQAARFIKR